ncbi:MAG: hypothetical protein QXM27_02145 [Candidatus Pacearchaeota archaeon]
MPREFTLNKKSQMQQFAWIFSIIVGALILFFAFFFVSQYSKQIAIPTKQITLEKSLDLLLEPFSAIGSLAEMRAEIIELPKDIYVEINCNEDYNEIKAREISHKNFDITQKVYEKYIFTKKINTKSKTKFFAFSLPIEIPFYVATATVIVTNDTCVSSLPYQYRENLKEIYDLVKDKVDTKIEFDCSTINNPYIDFDGIAVAYLFSDLNNFDCNLDRILRRAINIAEIYKEKAMLMQAKGCNMKNVIYALDNYINAIKNFKLNKQNFLSSINELNNANSELSPECSLF